MRRVNPAMVSGSLVVPQAISKLDVNTLDEITERPARFEERYNQRAVPFDWNFGRDDLDKLCARIDAHRPAA